MNLLKNKISYILFTFLVIFNLSIIIIPFNVKNITTYTVSLICGNIAICAQYFTLSNFIAGKNLKSKIYGFSIYKISISYLIIQIMISILFFVLGNYICIKPWIIILIEIIFHFFVALGLIASNVYKETLINYDNDLNDSIQYTKELRNNLESINNLVVKIDVKEKIDDILELLKYSDPVSSKYALDVEDKIINKMEMLKNDIYNEDYDGAMDRINSIENLIKERNLITKSNKGK